MGQKWRIPHLPRGLATSQRELTISRASIINSLNRMAKSGVLDSKEITGKGGHRGLYAATKSESELRKMIVEELTQSNKQNLG
jgi:predicted transcriptional regulator